MKIILLGKGGMLATDLAKQLKNTTHKLVEFGITDLDITKKLDFKQLESENADIIINCAAYTKVDYAEVERGHSNNINFNGVKNIANFCKIHDIILLHISTDYVFNGRRGYYNEYSKMRPINHYGKTKYRADKYILQTLDKYYIIRTSWLFGKYGINFVNTMLSLFDKKEDINVVDDQYGCPTYTVDLSKKIINIIDNITKNNFGIYHLTNNGDCSWYEFAKEISELVYSTCKINKVKTEDYPTSAIRPKNTILLNNKTEKLPFWKDALKRYLEERK